MIGKNELLSSDQIKRISLAVRHAEQGTSGEIVPMIVRRSSAVGHIPLYAGVIVFSLSSVAMIESQPEWLHRWWGLPIAFVFLVSLLIGFILSQFHFIQRWLIPAADEESQVWNRAYAEWAEGNTRNTKGRTGILLFVSIMERKAIVLADDGIAKHYPKETWQSVIDLLTKHLHKGEWTEGFENAIQKCGEILKTHLPSSNDDRNELSNRIIIKN